MSTSHQVNAKVNLLNDIPHLVWSRILSLYQVEENDLWSLCLASAEIDNRIIWDSPGLKESLIVKKLVAVLTRYHYLNSYDLLNCLNSGSQGLENAAAQGWRYLKNTVSGSNVKFNDSRSILKFMEDVERQGNIWTAFIRKSFQFNGDNLQTLRSEREDYVRTVQEFLRRYGKFIFHVFMNNIPWTDELERIVFLKRLFRTLPNIHHFQQVHNQAYTDLRTSFDITNKRNVTSFFKIEGGIGDPLFNEIFGRQCHTWHLDFWDFPRFRFVCPQSEIYKSVKVLEMKAPRFTLKHTYFTGFVNLKQLILHGEDMRTLTLVEKFPQVREVILYCAMRGCMKKLLLPPSCTLPFVKKLTLPFHHRAPPSLDKIATVLPSLQHVCLRAEMTAFKLQNCLKKWKNRGVFQNDIIDIYDLYAEGESLSGSNIWQHMENLNTLVVECIAEQMEWEPNPGMGVTRCGYTIRNDIYSRNDGSVTWKQESVLDDEWRFF